MTKPFKTLRAKMSPEAQSRMAERTAALLAEMDLQQLRQKAAAISQTEVADVLGVRQPAVSKLENSDDMLVSSLRDYIQALGGRLEIRAYMKEQEVRLTQFDAVGRELKKKLAPAR